MNGITFLQLGIPLEGRRMRKDSFLYDVDSLSGDNYVVTQWDVSIGKKTSPKQVFIGSATQTKNYFNEIGGYWDL